MNYLRVRPNLNCYQVININGSESSSNYLWLRIRLVYLQIIINPDWLQQKVVIRQCTIIKNTWTLTIITYHIEFDDSMLRHTTSSEILLWKYTGWNEPLLIDHECKTGLLPAREVRLLKVILFVAYHNLVLLNFHWRANEVLIEIKFISYKGGNTYF